MTDHDTLELRRIVESDPVPATVPDLAALIGSGRRARARRRALSGGVALGAAVVVAIPLLTLTGGPTGDPVSDPSLARDVTTSAPPAPAAAAPVCGVLSCVDPDSTSVETGAVIDELSVNTLPNGAEEILYVARTESGGPSADLTIDVLSAGYRDDGKIFRSVWALEPGSGDSGLPRFWSGPGPANGRPGDSDEYVVLGYVDGSPEAITWTTPDGEAGRADGILRLDGYTAFYLTRPLPDDYVPPSRVTRNADGSHTVETDEGPRTFRSGDRVRLSDLLGDATEFAPDLTVHTSDGWSCSLKECATGG